MADKKTHAKGVQKAAKKRMGQIMLTPKDMSQQDIEQKAMGMGLIDPLADVQPTGGVPQAPKNILVQTPAGQGAPPQPGQAAVPAPAPAPAAPAQTPIGPGVTVSPPVIRPAPAAPAPAAAAPQPVSILAPPTAGSDMPDPHAPEPQDEEPDEDEDDSYGAMPWRMG